MFEIIRRIWKTGLVTQDPLLTAAPPRYRGKLCLQQSDCTGCGRCVEACPTGAIQLQRETLVDKLSVSYEKCIFCGLCAEACTEGVITLSQDYHLATKKKSELIQTAEGGLHVSELSEVEQAKAEELHRQISAIFGRSLHIRHVDSGSCNGCDFEMSTLNNPIYDVQRFGIDFVASPRHADMLMVTGGVTRHLEEAVQKTYKAVAEPKLVVAVGACACGGGIVGQTYASRGGVDRILPVTVYIPGCPPRPQALIEGILLALNRYDHQQEGIRGK